MDSGIMVTKGKWEREEIDRNKRGKIYGERRKI